MSTIGTTRLAPSPTGALHLGNARTFLVNHLLASAGGWRVLMRVEDLDSPRVHAGADAQMLDELAWLGLEWEEPILYQSRRGHLYRQALRKLAECGAAYPCTCSRKDIEQSAGAPHDDDGTGVYPGTCRGRFASAEEAAAQAGRPAAWRIKTDDEPVEFHDDIHGRVRFNLAKTGGDFVVFKNVNEAAYQLAVVVDDDATGVNRIVRGDDLLDSAARQIHLRRLLGMDGQVRYWHLPLVVGPDGRRLAKRHGDTRVAHYRAAGTPPERVLGLLGYWSGLLPNRREAEIEDLARVFDIARLPRRAVVFSKADDDFLLGR
jgi:glutamyl-tRNA synthetase